MAYRLLKMVCQAVLVSEDDDGNLVEETANPIVVTPKDLPDFPTNFATQLATLNNQKGNTNGD